MAFFVGEGYSDDFSRHMAQTLTALLEGGTVQLTCAVDAVCQYCPENQDGQCRKPGLVAGYDRAVLDRCGLEEGEVLPFAAFVGLVQERIIAPGLRESICGGCQWNALCRSVPSRWETGE